MTSDNDTDL